jgi:hypothetical protein
MATKTTNMYFEADGITPVPYPQAFYNWIATLSAEKQAEFKSAADRQNAAWKTYMDEGHVIMSLAPEGQTTHIQVLTVNPTPESTEPEPKPDEVWLEYFSDWLVATGTKYVSTKE